jgi:hypothetical protein
MVKYKVGDVVQFKNMGNPFMWLVQLHNLIKYRKTGATHSGIITRIEGNDIFISEAISVVPFQEFPYTKEWLDRKIEEGKIWIRRSKVKLTNVTKHAETYWGRKYDWLAIYGIFIKTILGFESRISKKFKGDKFLICSEGVLRILYDASNKKLDLTKEFNKDNDYIAPIVIDLSKQFETIK